MNNKGVAVFLLTVFLIDEPLSAFADKLTDEDIAAWLMDNRPRRLARPSKIKNSSAYDYLGPLGILLGAGGCGPVDEFPPGFVDDAANSDNHFYCEYARGLEYKLISDLNYKSSQIGYEKWEDGTYHARGFSSSVQIYLKKLLEDMGKAIEEAKAPNSNATTRLAAFNRMQDDLEDAVYYLSLADRQIKAIWEIYYGDSRKSTPTDGYLFSDIWVSDQPRVHYEVGESGPKFIEKYHPSEHEAINFSLEKIFYDQRIVWDMTASLYKIHVDQDGPAGLPMPLTYTSEPKIFKDYWLEGDINGLEEGRVLLEDIQIRLDEFFKKTGDFKELAESLYYLCHNHPLIK